ncbi:hypothetical protein SDC9_201914 [bioreactor metagenome]|uniref:Uncharacterized protein n=1 Tax=bioreactor metagenome TaxID=1076179 RepID=A0A645J170_9ZZZZ
MSHIRIKPPDVIGSLQHGGRNNSRHTNQTTSTKVYTTGKNDKHHAQGHNDLRRTHHQNVPKYLQTQNAWVDDGDYDHQQQQNKENCLVHDKLF